MDEEEFADFTSAFSTTEGSKDFHEIGGNVFEIPPLDDFVFDTSTIPLETHTSSSTHKPDELFGKFESSFEMTTSINNNSDASLPNGNIVSSTVPSLCSPPPLTDLPPLNTFSDFTSCDITPQNISFIPPQVPENIQKFEIGISSSNPKDSEKLENNDDKEFGEFTSSSGGGGESVGNDKDDNISAFANFSTFPSEVQTKEKTETPIFGDFSSFSQTPMTTEEPIDVSKLPDPLTMTVDENPSDEGFGNFASFENQVTTTIKEPMDILKLPDPLTTSESNEDEFGAFGTFQTSHSVPSTVKNKEQFGNFTAFTNHSILDKDEDASEKPKKDEEEPEHLRSDKMEDSDDEFGEFGSTDTTGDKEFGDFSGFNKATPPATNTPVNQDSSKSTFKMSVDVIVTCFPVNSNLPTSSSFSSQLIDLLVLKEDKNTEGTWKYMKKETVSPSSLYQWNQSLLQDRFYGSLKVDQMLVPTTTKSSGIIGNDPFSFQSGGDLLEGFGLQGITASQAKDKQFGWSNNTGEEGVTLLDLSLPISPLNQPEKGIDGFSFDSDLQGLDLTADIINPSTDPTQSGDTYTSWMDSELLELEVESSRMTAAVTTTGESTLEWLTNLSNTNPELTTMVKTDVSTSQTTPSFSDSTAMTLLPETNPLSNDPGLDQLISVAIAGLDLLTTVPPDLDVWSDTKETGTDDASVTSHDTGDITGVPDTTPVSSSRTSSLVRSPTISSIDIMLNQMLEDNNETAITHQDKGLSIEAKALLNKLPDLSFMMRTINKDQFV